MSKGGGGKGHGHGHGPRHAFKVLCPEQMMGGLIGSKGSVRDQIQDETGCRLLASNRDEHYPGTRYRILLIFAEDNQGIVGALARVVEKIVEYGVQERAAQPDHSLGEADYIGKEPGEYVMRAIIPVKASGAIIGTGGSNIQTIRSENNAKIFIDKTTVSGHQLVKIIAGPGGLRGAAVAVNEFVQEEAKSDGFAEWAAIRSFGEPSSSQTSHSSAPHASHSSSVTSSGTGKGAAGSKGSSSGQDRSWEPRRVSPHVKRDWGEHGGGYSGGSNGQSLPPLVDGQAATPAWHQDRQASSSSSHWRRRSRSRSPQRVAPRRTDAAPVEATSVVNEDALRELSLATADFPEGTIDQEYAITCSLPRAKVSVLIGKHGDHIKGVQRTTGARVVFEQENGSDMETMIITGPLIGTYRAHALMMRRYHEDDVEQEEAAKAQAVPEPPPADVSALQAKVEALQKELQMVQAQTSAAKGKGKGKKGK